MIPVTFCFCLLLTFLHGNVNATRKERIKIKKNPEVINQIHRLLNLQLHLEEHFEFSSSGTEQIFERHSAVFNNIDSRICHLQCFLAMVK